MSQKALKIIAAIATALFLLMSLATARIAGENQALHDLNDLYLRSACGDISALRKNLEAQDLSDLKVTETQRKGWIEFHLSKCNQH